MPDTTAAPRFGDRSLFPDLESAIYLAHSGISPLSAPVQRAVADALSGQSMPGIGALVEAADLARERFAALVGGEARQVAVQQNTSTGIVAVALGLAWRPGDRVVLFEDEFPANVTPWQRAAATFGLELAFVPVEPFHADPEAGLARVRAELERGARLVAVSAVQFQTGLAMPLEALGALCREHGALLFVDAIQTVGARPFPAGAADFVACGGHKWLMGPFGAGFLWVADRALPELEPRCVSWMGHEEPLRFLSEPGVLAPDRPLQSGAQVFETGALAFASLAGLAESMRLLGELGVDAIHAHVQAWHDALEPALVDLGFESLRSPRAEGRSAILSLRPPAGHAAQAIAEALGARGVAVTAPDGCLRIAPHWPNAPEEAAHVTRVVRDALAG